MAWHHHDNHITPLGLRLYACFLDAHANPLCRPRLSCVWQDFLQAVAAEGTHEDSHRREAVQLSSLQQIFLGQIKPQSSSADSQRRQTFHVPQVWEELCSQVLPRQTQGNFLLWHWELTSEHQDWGEEICSVRESIIVNCSELYQWNIFIFYEVTRIPWDHNEWNKVNR